MRCNRHEQAASAEAPLVIGFDIDDTITAHPAFFAVVSQALRGAGHRVVIITMRVDAGQAAADLAAFGVVYDELHCFDLDQRGDYWGWKGRLCASLGVEAFFDDSPDILARMPATTLPFLAVHRPRHDLSLLSEADEEEIEGVIGAGLGRS